MSDVTSRRVLLTGASLVFGVVCVLPLAYMLAAALRETAVLGSASIAFQLDTRQQELLLNSVTLGGSVAALATLIGAPLGFVLARVQLPARALWRVALAAPLIVPPYVMGLAWIYIGGSWAYSLPAASVVLALVFYPLSMLATEVALRRVDPRAEEAALIVAGAHRVLHRITWPLILPTVSAAGLVIFVLAITEFGVPGLLQVRVFTTEILTAFAALYDFRRATALTLPVLLIVLGATWAASSLVGDREIVSRRATAGDSPVSISGGRGIAVAFAFATIILAAALAAPLLVLSSEARGVPSIRSVVQGSGAAIVNGLWLAALAATLSVGLAVWLGYARARARAGTGRLADGLFFVLFAAPSTVVGIGLIGVWNQPGLVGRAYGTDAMIVVAYMARFAPVAALLLSASIRQVPTSTEEAAAVSGAPWLRTFWRIVLPQIALGLLAAWVVTFVLAFGEVGASLLVAPPGESALAIRIYTLIANTPASYMATLALLQVIVVLAPLTALSLWLLWREGR